MKPVKVNTLAACITAIGFSPIIYAADNTPTVILDTVTVKGTRNKDEIGKNRVYTREIVNLYKGKNEVETFKGNTVSDLLSGMSGVYSGDARNSGALDPNIRGVQGQGRIPVTIDGTEQAITVWRGYAGANNRNYVDPNIISSVSIEKGPSFSRDMKSGIGGSVALKTIDADDIVPEGQKYGFEVKAEASNNSIKQRANVYEKSVDYRTLDAPAVALGGIWRAMLDDTDRIDQRFNGRNKFGKDKAYRIAAATKQDNFDAMLAYAYRSKGNYFSGKKGAERYGYIGPWTMETVNELNRRIADAAARGEKFYGSENMLGSPDIAKIGLFYHPGGEVTNTSLETKSWVGKTTFRLPNHQTLKFGLRHTDAIFGEIMPSRVIGPIYATPENLNKIAEWPKAWVKQRSYNIDYAWKPEGSRWIDLSASLWTTRTKSKTNTAGGSPGDALYEDRVDNLSSWKTAMNRWHTYDEETKRIIEEAGYTKKPDVVEQLPNTNGRFNTIEGNAYYANNTRNGFNFSNRMKLHDKLTLTLMGDFQNEKLRSRNEFAEELRNEGRDKYPEEVEEGKIRANYELTNFGEPRNGRCREWNFGFNFRYQPLNWLTLTAGARYTNFKIQDHSERLKTGIDSWGQPLMMNRGMAYKLTRVATEQEYRDYLNAVNNDEFNAASDSIVIDERGVAILNPTPHNDENRPRLDKLEYYWLKDDKGRLNPSTNPIFSTPSLVTPVVNPAYDPNNPDSPRMVLPYKVLARDGGDNYLTPITPAELQRARKQGGSGWAPAFSATVNFTDYARAYLRYTETLRFPSIFEGTYGFSTAAGSFARYGYGWKPEHAKNWEIGYIHDLTGLFPKMKSADFRINYFHNKTKNVIDRDYNLEFEQFDKLLRTGVELQTRFDTGKFFGGLGVLRTLKNWMCDDSYAYRDIDVVSKYLQEGKLIKHPTCNHGSITGGYLATAIQPRWSIDADLGGRFFSNKLESGVRFHFHSRVYQNRRAIFQAYYDQAGYGKQADPDYMRWQPVATWDAYLRYKIGKNLTAELVGTNLGNRYYLDPINPTHMPAPGRTIRIGITGKF